jgi:hypothetical protein
MGWCWIAQVPVQGLRKLSRAWISAIDVRHVLTTIAVPTLVCIAPAIYRSMWSTAGISMNHQPWVGIRLASGCSGSPGRMRPAISACLLATSNRPRVEC